MKMSFQCFLTRYLCFKLKLFVPTESFVYDSGRISMQTFLFSGETYEKILCFLYHVRNGILMPRIAIRAINNSRKLHLLVQLFCLLFIKENPKPYEQMFRSMRFCLNINLVKKPIRAIRVCSNLFAA